MKTDPKNIHDALRRLSVLVSCIGRDTQQFLEDPTAYVASEYFSDVLDTANDAQHLVVWIRTELRKKNV